MKILQKSKIKSEDVRMQTRRDKMKGSSNIDADSD
jgi:hypothetical protein